MLMNNTKIMLMRKIKEGMISDRVSERILWLTIVFFIAFF